MLRGKWAVLKSIDDLPKLDSFPENVLNLCQDSDDITNERANEHLPKVFNNRLNNNGTLNNVRLTPVEVHGDPESLLLNRMTLYANQPGLESTPVKREVIVKVCE